MSASFPTAKSFSLCGATKGRYITHIKDIEFRLGCRFEDIPPSHIFVRHAPGNRSGFEVASNIDSGGGVPSLVLEGVDRPTVGRDRLDRRKIVR